MSVDVVEVRESCWIHIAREVILYHCTFICYYSVAVFTTTDLSLILFLFYFYN